MVEILMDIFTLISPTLEARIAWPPKKPKMCGTSHGSQSANKRAI
jgi:hypothetical protein